MKGVPGAGKTLLARALLSILPLLTLPEALDITRIYSVADALTSDEPLIRVRPLWAPHHTISHAGLVGGGRWPRPGEVSMSHLTITHSVLASNRDQVRRAVQGAFDQGVHGRTVRRTRAPTAHR